jgi:hypothetical protein
MVQKSQRKHRIVLIFKRGSAAARQGIGVGCDDVRFRLVSVTFRLIHWKVSWKSALLIEDGGYLTGYRRLERRTMHEQR